MKKYLFQHNKVVIIGLMIVCIMIIVLLLLISNNTTLPSENEVTPIVTQIPEVQEPSPTPTIPISIHPDSPDFPIVSPQPQTGALEEPLEQSEIDSINQEQALRAASPVREPKFTVSYDWGEDYFSLELKEPKNEALDAFNQWRATSYNGIAESRFQLQ